MMLIALGSVIVLCIEVAIPCDDCRTGGLAVQVTAGHSGSGIRRHRA
jgi:hypothetical protein